MVSSEKGGAKNSAGAAVSPRDKAASPKGGALVVVDPCAETARPCGRSRLLDALFLAHMVATRFQAPQTRAKRRTDPATANASYRAATKGRKPRTGLVFSRKI